MLITSPRRSRPLSVPYIGHRNRWFPYSIVIKGQPPADKREALVTILSEVCAFATQREALAAQARVREDLRPWTRIETFCRP